MAALRYRYQTAEFGDYDIHFRCLRDRCQFTDIDGEAAALGISSTLWPLFGLVWPSGEILAQLMSTYDIQGKRILEIGCGVGLASLVLNARQADISATDLHPSAETFLAHNTELNSGAPIPFLRIGWDDAQNMAFGDFDLIIGSYLFYGEEHAEMLSRFIEEYTKPDCEVLMVVATRGYGGKFAQAMEALGFNEQQLQILNQDSLPEQFQGKIHRFQRSAPA